MEMISKPDIHTLPAIIKTLGAREDNHPGAKLTDSLRQLCGTLSLLLKFAMEDGETPNDVLCVLEVAVELAKKSQDCGEDWEVLDRSASIRLKELWELAIRQPA